VFSIPAVALWKASCRSMRDALERFSEVSHLNVAVAAMVATNMNRRTVIKDTPFLDLNINSSLILCSVAWNWNHEYLVASLSTNANGKLYAQCFDIFLVSGINGVATKCVIGGFDFF